MKTENVIRGILTLTIGFPIAMIGGCWAKMGLRDRNIKQPSRSIIEEVLPLPQENGVRLLEEHEKAKKWTDVTQPKSKPSLVKPDTKQPVVSPKQNSR